MSTDINYDNYIENRIKKEEQPMTRTQSLLAQELFRYPDIIQMMAQPGDLQAVFNSIQRYIKGR